MKKAFLVALAICAMLLATTNSAQAQVINACVSKLTGLVRIVNSPSNCSTVFEKAISWNAVGPQGPQGPAGPAGAVGAQGPPGVTAGIKTAVYGTIVNSTQFDCSNDILTLYPNPAPFTVEHDNCQPNSAGYSYGSYKFTFTPNPFTPSTMGSTGSDNRPTCVAISRNNPFGVAGHVKTYFYEHAPV